MATWQTYGQLQNGARLAMNTTDRVWLTGTSYGSNVVVGSYQDGTHISDNTDVQRDTTSPLNNTKYLTATTVSLNGAASVALNTLTSGSASLAFNLTNASTIQTSAATFYAYDGATDTNGITGLTFQAAEIGTSTSWTAANGSGSALALADQSSASTSHWFFVGVSASPTTTGAKIGSIKLTLTFV